MNLEEYTSAVERGEYPSDPLVPEGAVFENDSGVIRNLLFQSVRSVALIESPRGAIRSNHYHKTDWHYLYVLSGQVLYFDRPKGAERTRVPEVFRAGQMFFTPPNVEHAVVFLEDTRLVSLAKNARTHREHEADMVRVDFVSREMADRFMIALG